jgi:hypothetical protein
MNSARKSYFSRLILMALLASVTVRAELKPETVAAFDHYVKAAEDEMDKHKGFRDFLWLDRQDPTLAGPEISGEVLARQGEHGTAQF